MASNTSTSEEPFFIVGSGRSGTTLLRAILNASPEVHIPPESDFIARAYRFVGRRRIGPEDYAYLAELFMRTSREKGWGLDRGDVVGALQHSRVTSLREANDAICALYLAKKELGQVWCGIKMPNLIFSIDTVLRLYPRARIIHMLRDGRDVYLSYKRIHDDSLTSSFGPNGIAQSALYWAVGMRNIEKHRDVLGDRLIEIKFEDLLSDPSSTMRRVCTFLAIDFREELWKEYYKSSKNKEGMTHRKRVHRKVGKEIDKTNKSKYLSQMSARDTMVFEMLAEPYLRKYDYRASAGSAFRSAAVLRPALYWAANAVNELRYWVREQRLYRPGVIGRAPFSTETLAGKDASS